MTDTLINNNNNKSKVQANINKMEENGQHSISDATSTVQQQAQNAINTMQAYVHEGQRIVSEQKTRSQDAAKKAVSTAHEYVEDARKKADSYMENARTSAQNAVDNAKGQVTAVRTLVTEKTQPYMSNYQEFDITKTAAFHALTHLISMLFYVAWRLTLVIPSIKAMIFGFQQKVSDAAVIQNGAVVVQRVPVVGHRVVEVVTIALNSIRTDLKEQMAQYKSATSRTKSA